MEDLISYAPCSGVAQIEGAHHSLSALMEYLRREPFTSVLWSFSLYFRRIPIIPQQQKFFRKGWGGPKEPPLTPSRPALRTHPGHEARTQAATQHRLLARQSALA